MFDFSPLWISLRAAILASIIVFFLGVCAARLTLHLKTRFAIFLDAFFTLPMVLPPTVLGFYLLIIFGRSTAFGSFLYKHGISIIFTWIATVIAAVVVSFPLMYRGARGAFEQIDNEHIWAARTLGMSEAAIFFRILIPEAFPGISASLALSFARALGEFGATMMIAGNIPKKTQTIPIAIYFSTAGGDFTTAWIWVVIISIISFASLYAMNLIKRKKT